MDAREDGTRDLDGAISELADRLPGALRPLAGLAYNYAWSWLPDCAGLWHDLDPAGWRRSGCDPRHALESAAPRRLRELARDGAFVARVDAAAAALAAELSRAPGSAAIPPERPVAYLCAEFGVHCSLPLYGGGLGVLAGDLLKAASDLALPVVGVGLLYREGYFRQRLDTAGWQHEYWTPSDFERSPAVRVTRADLRPLRVSLELGERTVWAQIWRVQVGRIPLYLLDTDREDNDPLDRWITNRLYTGDRRMRLAQYAVLGIAGNRALAAMGIRPSLVHLNEGHAALGSWERIRERMAQGDSFERALDAVRRESVFTTHTPVAAGNESYALEEVEGLLQRFLDGLGPSRAACVALARSRPDDAREPLGLTPLALRCSRAANGVARRHGEVARSMWQPLWPGRAPEQVPIGHVTNGVHVPTWMALPMQELLDRHLGRDWRRRHDDASLWRGISAIPDQELWAVRRALRLRLVDYARQRSVQDRLSRGEAHAYVEAAARVLSPDALTIGFARRLATYKRLYLLSQLPDQGAARLLGNRERPIQLVLAGKAHPRDDEAKETLRRSFPLRTQSGVGQRVVFLEDYDLHMAPRIVAGVDLWLNLPRPPLEASGTSGMKVALNGGLNLSVLDGWWVEGHDPAHGWAIESPAADAGRQDEHDARALLTLLEGEVIPLFYERDAAGLPRRWLARIKASLASLVPRFSAERMLRDYLESVYAETPAQSATR